MCERSVPQAAIPPPQMTIDDTNSSWNHKAWSDYKHNESLTYYCWLNGAMGKGHGKRFSGVFPLFYSSRLFTFYGPTLGLRVAPFFFLCLFLRFFFPFLMTALKWAHVFSCASIPSPGSVCVRCHPEKHKCAPPPPPHPSRIPPPPPPSCVFDKNLPGLFSPLSAALTVSSSAFSSLHAVMWALNKSRPAWTLTRAFACANTRADVMRARTPSNMVPIMSLSFSKWEQYSPMTDECCAPPPQGALTCRKTNEVGEQHHYCHHRTNQMRSAAFFHISQERGQSKQAPGCRRVFTRDLPRWGGGGGKYQAIYRSCVTTWACRAKGLDAFTKYPCMRWMKIRIFSMLVILL